MNNPQSVHSAVIERTAASLMTSLSLLLPESGLKATLSHTSYFTRYNMQGDRMLRARTESLGALLCDYESLYGVAHAVDSDWFLIENAADAAAFRLFENDIIIPVNQDQALEGLSTYDHANEGVQMFREVKRIASDATDWPLSCVALRPFFH